MKKDFTNNPALSFISSVGDDRAEADTPKVRKEKKETPQRSGKAPANLNLLEETQSKRLNLTIQPTIYQMAKQRAAEQGQSTNNFIIQAIIKALQEDK